MKILNLHIGVMLNMVGVSAFAAAVFPPLVHTKKIFQRVYYIN